MIVWLRADVEIDEEGAKRLASEQLANTVDPESERVRLAAVGDILLCPTPDAATYARSKRLVADDIADIFESCDLVFGNLECTLASNQSLVPTEPRVIADAESIRAVKEAGFDVVTLANNHAFDALDGGFRELKELLKDIDLRSFGAGLNLDEATSPTIVDVKRLRIAFIGAVDHRSGPFQFASESTWGVAPLDVDHLASQIRQLRSQTDHVVVSLHWGEERFFLPAPVQVRQARQLIDAGASMVLGHHPHVLQGLEIYQGAPIIYSLGNFVADDVSFENGDAIRWNRVERTGCVLVVELSRDSVDVVGQHPTYDDGQCVTVDTSGYGRRRITKTARAMAQGVSPSRYRREHLWVKTVRPALEHLRPSQLKNLRPSHFQNALRMLARSRRAE